ncbi:hypothetical protein E2C01_043215 [Portunus trituberculatus]|uniref:Uncharacterized protein n=1 Tax=Portunus trituberculatus TaxID=210409 RepID=A0A5B7FV44_PORTR|nr:hypothetical protein [Portunus trituberculatus]
MHVFLRSTNNTTSTKHSPLPPPLVNATPNTSQPPCKQCVVTIHSSIALVTRRELHFPFT